ncbi:hypothetical protein [Knoellia koreensis]|uniref:PH domain-containing protein n=1 Tax=Knoellia koreensis TaxID=2730921 RepID=A0A849HKP8_9MICO|nr:hypothetical protein [Knoellia sp. DB2414S]NNM47124.1 hypothetical protein [Knoellia sp. DB2414S]
MTDDGNRWGQHAVAPPSLDDAVLVVRAQRHLLWRAALPSGVIGLVLWWAGVNSDKPLPGLVSGGVLLVLSLLRVAFWDRGMAARSIVSTPTHLVLCQHGRPRRWIRWSAIQRLTVTRSTLLPEWSRNGAWFEAFPTPALNIEPPMAIVGGLGPMLISRRASASSAASVRAVAVEHGIPFD